ncbi:MAG: MinD/ParA family protein [Isosphaeraceae bacterium]
MSDQADGLRELVRARSGTSALADLPPPPARVLEAPPRARSLVFTSGKGGVGTSNLALNLAVALGALGQRVVLVDADLGLANIDLLCGLSPPHDLGDVLSGVASLADAVVEGPGRVRVLTGAHGMRALPEVLGDGPARLAAELAALESAADLLIIDAGGGLGPGIATLAAAADEVVIVTTPEPTSVADAHATIARFRKLSGVRLRSSVNQASSRAEAHAVLTRLESSCRQFLGAVVTPLGYVRSDPRVPASVRTRQPFLLAYPHSAASRGVRRLARDLIAERRPRAPRPGFFASLVARWALSRVAR